DLLAQLPYAESVSEELRRKARRALRAINRFPVCELVDLLPAQPAEPPEQAEALAPPEAPSQSATMPEAEPLSS
ncbi:MAG: hypothetical protein ACK550_00525, partial [Synechococcaceae cyanobacterium]